MFRSILVPLDRTPESASAVPLALDIAEASGAAVHFLTAVSTTDSAEPETASHYLEALVARLQVWGLDVDFEVQVGEPASAILSFAQSHTVDLIVMETRAPSNRSILALTSVAHQVLSASPCPVLLLRSSAKYPIAGRTLLVPIDGSPGAALAVILAHGIARLLGNYVVLLDVVVPVPAFVLDALPDDSVTGDINSACQDIAEATARSYVDTVAAHLSDLGVDCEGRVATGDVATEILRCADEINADMVVMSTHSVPWPARASVSSVADRVLREGSRPVLLVRREPLLGEPPGSSAGGTASQTACRST